MPTAARTHKATHTLDRRVSDRRYDAKRDSNELHTRQWRRFRLWFLSRHPLCAECERNGWSVAANEVHHLIERSVCPERTFDEENCQALCKSCHTRKSNYERRGTGSKSLGSGGR